MADRGRLHHMLTLGVATTTVAGVALLGTPAGAATAGGPNETRPTTQTSVEQELAGQGGKPYRADAAGVPKPPSLPVVAAGSGSTAWRDGLTHADQRLAGTGLYANTQFSLEPPDQALCVGAGRVIEGVNTALRNRSAASGAVTGPAVAVNQFFGLIPEIDRTSIQYGDFTSDPKCLYDAGTWYVTVLQADIDRSTGAFLGPTSALVATSTTGDVSRPADWRVFRIDTTNEGNNCPCLGDQPLIGADANGFYVSTNAFSLVDDSFSGAFVYAVKKGVRGQAPTPTAPVVGSTIPQPPTTDRSLLPAGALGGDLAYSVQPAVTPPGAAYPSGHRQFFLSALDYTGAGDSRIGLWTLSGTDRIGNAANPPSLTGQVLSSLRYSQPPSAQQRDGARPLAATVYAAPNGKPARLNSLNSNDDRMNQVVYAAGRLWSGVNTAIRPDNGPVRTGIAWFAVDPAAKAVAQQGYVSANQASALFPAIGVSPSSGAATMVFTLVGPSIFPSAAFVRLTSATPRIEVAAAGTEPADGFSGYEDPDGVERWGDYSAAATDESGNVWLATEYIPGGPRTLLANWGSAIVKVAG